MVLDEAILGAGHLLLRTFLDPFLGLGACLGRLPRGESRSISDYLRLVSLASSVERFHQLGTRLRHLQGPSWA